MAGQCPQDEILRILRYMAPVTPLVSSLAMLSLSDTLVSQSESQGWQAFPLFPKVGFPELSFVS